MRAAGWIQDIQVGKTPNPFSLLVATATDNEIPKPIYRALLKAMPNQSARHQRWARSILCRLIAHRSGRNAALCQAVIEFRPLIAQGLISLDDATLLLVMGMRGKRISAESWACSGCGNHLRNVRSAQEERRVRVTT